MSPHVQRHNAQVVQSLRTLDHPPELYCYLKLRRHLALETPSAKVFAASFTASVNDCVLTTSRVSTSPVSAVSTAAIAFLNASTAASSDHKTSAILLA